MAIAVENIELISVGIDVKFYFSLSLFEVSFEKGSSQSIKKIQSC